MGELGYTYHSFYATSVRSETRGTVGKPFAPFVPKVNGNSESSVTKKTRVPISSSTNAYGDDHYRGGDDDEWRNHQPTSPVRGSPRRVDEFPTRPRPARSIPVTSPTPNYGTGANGYGDYGSNKPDSNYGHGNKEGIRPIFGSNKNNQYDYGHRDGSKPIGSTIKNDPYDHGYSGTSNPGYGNYGNYGNKPNGSTIKNDKYDGTNGYHGNYKPVGGTNRNENHDGYNNGTNYGYGSDYGGNKEGHKLSGSPPVNNDYYHGSPDNSKRYGHGGYDEDYYNKDKEGHKPPSGYGGHGIGNNNFGVASPTKNNGHYDDDKDYGNYHNNNYGHVVNGAVPKISSDWTTAPRKGTPLSEPTHDIDKAMELLRNGNGHRPYDSKNDYRYDGPGPVVSKNAAPPTSKFDNLHISQPISPVSNKDEKRTSQPPRFTTNLAGGRGADYGTINHKDAEKKFGGTTI